MQFAERSILFEVPVSANCSLQSVVEMHKNLLYKRLKTRVPRVRYLAAIFCLIVQYPSEERTEDQAVPRHWWMKV
jgi:hypothetical protein